MYKDDTFLEFPLKIALQAFPGLPKFIPKDVDLSDENYIIRFSLDGAVELGYPDDPEWYIK